jgi:hypothetical protein
MSSRSDEALALAGDICCSVVYVRIADLVASTKRYCDWDACPLSVEQEEQLIRAVAEATDGMLSQIAGCVDARRAFGLLEGIGEQDA